MCVACNTVDDQAVIRKARSAADEILGRYLGVPIAKALDLSTPRGFDGAVAEIASKLGSATYDSDEAAIKAALEVLDVDWHATTAVERRKLISGAMRAAGRKTAEIPAKAKVVFSSYAEDVVGASRKAARRTHRLSIAADFNAVDRRVIDYLDESSSLFILDDYGRRLDSFGDEVGVIVGRGLEQGFGRDAIARNLERAAQAKVAGRSSFYWDVVAGSFVGRGRSFAQLSAFAEARIERYVIEAVLDEVTTETCRFLHGKVFSVGRGLDLFRALETNPGAEKELNPWVRTGTDDEGRRLLYVNQRGRRTPLAMIERSGMGTRDDVGRFSRSLSEREMADMGIGFPPYHGLCRSTPVPLI